jgi:exonuclease SbcC
MFIKRVELENIKSYRRITIDFRRGTTAISGANGAGKTTIVEAIGYALFDALPYKATQFVREGEKYGRVVVHLIGSDDRPYEVERRFGSGAHWILNDIEANLRLEQSADVSGKLHDIFGIERERSLSALFEDALGVPQGMFATIFLEKPAQRKQTFNALLQVEDYRTAFEYLLEAQRQYKEQAQQQQTEIQRLEFETRDLDAWRAELHDKRAEHQQKTTQLTQWSEQLEQALARQQALMQQRDTVTRLQHQFEQRQNVYESNQKRLQDREQELRAARAAQEAVERSRPDYERYQQADDALKLLRQNERRRNELRQQQAKSSNVLTQIRGSMISLQGRLDDIARARQQVVDLLPLVEQQHELGQQRDELTRQVERYDAIVKDGKRVRQQLDASVQRQQEAQARIEAIEPLLPLAALLQERNVLVASLQAQADAQTDKQKQYQEKRQQLQAKLRDRETSSALLRRLEDDIAAIEAHREEAESLPALLQEFEQAKEQRARLDSSMESYRKSRKQAGGGLCPFLQEPCLNIKQRGMSNLNSYFDSMIAEEKAQLDIVMDNIGLLSTRVNEVSKYASTLGTLGMTIERRDHQADHLQRLAIEIAGLEREIKEQESELERLKDIRQQIAEAEQARDESQRADEQTRGLDGLRIQLQQAQEMGQQLEERIQELRQQEQELRGSKEQLAAVKLALVDLNDPRGQTKALRERVQQEPAIQEQLRSERQNQLTAEQELQALEEQLAAYARLDQQIGQQEAVLQQTRAGYQTYLTNEQAAQSLPQREQAYRQMIEETARAETVLRAAERAYQEAYTAFDAAELTAVDTEIEQLHKDLSQTKEALSNTHNRITALEQQIGRAEALLVELEAARKEKATLEDLDKMMGHFRNLIKEAGPQVLHAMLADISAEANRIFGEIMGDRAAQLSWQSEYEIILRRQGVNRTFAQLSGGEQMSAALAVRLALLKKLSALNIAFFDEPTQNMDELRRMNLAEQIRRVRGFDQLIVISHDDTFEQGLDSIIRLKKVDGETRLISDDEFATQERERVDVYVA